MKSSILIFIAIFLSNAANAQESYLCVSEASGGVSYDSSTQKWRGAVFRNDEKKFLITKKDNKWTMKEFGKSFETDCTQPNEFGVMSCNKILGDFNFSTKTRRYLSTYIAGYIDGSNNNENTPNIQIGICSKL